MAGYRRRAGDAALTRQRPASVAAPPRAGPAPVIRTFDARAADAAHRGHALLIAGVVAGLRTALVVVDGAPRIIVSRLGTARLQAGEQGRGGKQKGCLNQAHGASPG